MSDPCISDSPHANKEGEEPNELTPRVTNFHWIVVNVPIKLTALPAGPGPKSIMPSGKKPGETPYGLAEINNFNAKFKSLTFTKLLSLIKTKISWQGVSKQHDGPCPPWNDKIMHAHDHKLYAIQDHTAGLRASFTTNCAF